MNSTILKKIVDKEPLTDEDIKIIVNDHDSRCDGCPIYTDWCKRCPINKKE